MSSNVVQPQLSLQKVFTLPQMPLLQTPVFITHSFNSIPILYGPFRVITVKSSRGRERGQDTQNLPPLSFFPYNYAPLLFLSRSTFLSPCAYLYQFYLLYELGFYFICFKSRFCTKDVILEKVSRSNYK